MYTKKKILQNVSKTWLNILDNDLLNKIIFELNKKSNCEYFPLIENIFETFKYFETYETKVILLGQDPYHGPNQAMGLSFSVPQGQKVPASLKRIYKELASDIEGFQIPTHGDLTTWANQGVFLLNAGLTVEHKKANSHKKAGWHKFTDAVIKNISEKQEGIVFLLWGNFARKKKELIDTAKHHVLESPHPSPLARGFLGCKHFSQCNALLKQQGKTPIEWQV